MKKILIIGASGLIGQALLEGLEGYDIETFRGRDILTTDISTLVKSLQNKDAVINLSGKNIFTIWTRKNRKAIYSSRVDTGKRIAEAIKLCDNPPKHILNASAIGVYESEIINSESDSRFDSNFLSRVVIDWEESIKGIPSDITFMRIGIVMARKGGAYKILRLLTRLQLGAYFNKGSQGFSFIFIDDIVRAVDFIIRERVYGAVNMVSPDYTTYKEMMKVVKRKHKAFIIWPVPGFIMKILFGEASLLFLKGHRIVPELLNKKGFKFIAPDIETCIEKLESD